jgi:serine/threonine-protein kinase
VAAVIVALVVIVVLVMPDPKPPPPPPPPIAPASVNTLLLTTNETESIIGVSNLEPSKVYDQMTDSSTKISNTACAGAQFNAAKSVYDGSGYSAVADQVLNADSPQYVYVNQTVVLYPSADQAARFLSRSAEDWRNCAGESVTVTTEDGTTYNWSFDQVKDDSDNHQISQLTSQEGMGGYGCDHALRVVSNAVIETRACSDRITDEAGRMAEAMAAKAPS